MSFAAVHSTVKPGFDCYLMSIPAWRLFGFLNHDPQSRNWKNLKPWLRHIYEAKQRSTAKARIDALDQYITTRLMSKDKFAAFPPISIIQFEPLAEQLEPLSMTGAFAIEDGTDEVNRVLIDGLARVSAIQTVRERLEVENPEAYERLKNFQFSVALYVPSDAKVGEDIAGQLFTDFNSYAWPVPQAMTIADDVYNPYKLTADVVAKSDVLAQYGGVKERSANLGKKDTQFTTQLTLAQLCKVAVEGRRGIGKLTKPLSGKPKIAALGPDVAGVKIAQFLEALAGAMGRDRFGSRAQLFRTAHGLYALGVIMNDVFERRTTLENAVSSLAKIDWTWSNQSFRDHIGRQKINRVGEMQWHLNTGAGTIDYLISYCREACKILPVAA